MSALLQRPLHDLSRLLAGREISSRELAEACLARIEALEPELHAFLHLDPDGAMAQAGAVDAARARGEDLHPLAGIPGAIKDVISVSGMPNTCCSKILENYAPPNDATLAAM